MKRIQNYRTTACHGDLVVYNMVRRVAGENFGIAVAVTAYELEHGRHALAQKLWRTRHQLRRMMAIAASGQGAHDGRPR